MVDPGSCEIQPGFPGRYMHMYMPRDGIGGASVKGHGESSTESQRNLNGILTESQRNLNGI
jgi:hypothetical protein